MVVAALAVAGFVAAACGDAEEEGEAARTLAIQGREYAFVGVPETLPAGRTTFTFENIGTEEHMMVMVLLSEELTLQESLQLPKDELEKLVTLLGIVAAAPGETAAASLTVDFKPGRYGLVCFFERNGRSNAMQGMAAEFAVEP